VGVIRAAVPHAEEQLAVNDEKPTGFYLELALRGSNLFSRIDVDFDF
jgi:hypothetical protein